MMFLMFLVLIIQPDLTKDEYSLVVHQQTYASAKACADAGNALLEKVKKDQHVVSIQAGACLPTPNKQV